MSVFYTGNSPKLCIFAKYIEYKRKSVMIKKLFLCALACITFATAAADEGMWLPNNIKNRIKTMRKMGFKLKADDIYSDSKASLKDAVVQFGGGCTGEYHRPRVLHPCRSSRA